MSVIDDIAAERRRQIEVEGWTPEHDDEHGSGSMAQAAACYALRAARQNDAAHDLWPWDDAWWKPKDDERDLIRAAALIVAEIERRRRAAGIANQPVALQCICTNPHVITEGCPACTADPTSGY